MSAKRLQWVFELLDRMSGPGKRINATLEKTEKTLQKVNGHVHKHTSAVEKATRATNKLSEAHRHAGRHGDSFFMKMTGWYMGMQMGIAMVRGLTTAVLGLPYAFAKAGVAAASFKQDTMLGLNMILRDKGKATALYNEAVRFADISPFETQETLQWYRSLTGALGPENALQGLGTSNGSRVLKILSGLGDIASTQPNRSVAMGGLLTQVTQMLGKGKLLGQDMHIMAEHGVIRSEVYKRLAKNHGITPQEAMSQKWEGKFGANEALMAILDFSAERYGGGTIGGGMGPASRTASGLWSTLRSRPFRMMEDLGNTSGWASMTKALDNLVNALDPDTPMGKRIKANVELLFDRLMGGVFKRFEDPKAVEAWVNGLLDGVGKIIPAIERLGQAFGAVAEHLKYIDQVFTAGGKVSDFLWRYMPGVKGASDAYDLAGKGAAWWGGRGGVQSGEAQQMARIYQRLSGKSDRTWLEDIELQNALYYFRVHNMTPPGMTPAEKKPTGMILNPGAIQIDVNGAQDPKATAHEIRGALSSLFDGFAYEAGA